MSVVTEGPGDRAPVVRSAPLGGSALSRALQTGSAPGEWLTRVSGIDAWREQLASVRATSASNWLAALAPAFAATGAARERLARAAERGVVVTTGQQPGLFGGPTYTWSKAIAALALADELERTLGVPVAPVFWAATDDADWREAAVTHIVGAEGLETLELAGPATDGIAVAEVPLGEIDALRAALRAACGSLASDELLQLVERAYVPHATIGDAYVQLLRGVLEPLGIAVLDASHPALRIAADPLLRRALQKSPAIDETLQQRSSTMSAAGFTPQVEAVKGLTQVFRTTRGAKGNTRERVAIADATQAMREAEPGTLGANVLLRPVLERSLLPTMAYLAGPGELAYFAQVEPVADALGAPRPVAVPRWACTIVEPHVVRALDRLGVSEADFADPHAVETGLARRALREPVADSLERVRLAVETQMRALRDSVALADDLVPPVVVDGAAQQLAHRLDRLERRIVAAVKRRETALMRDASVVRASVRPLGKLPERVLNFVPALARYGSPLLDAMRVSAATHAKHVVEGSVPDAP